MKKVYYAQYDGELLDVWRIDFRRRKYNWHSIARVSHAELCADPQNPVHAVFLAIAKEKSPCIALLQGACCFTKLLKTPFASKRKALTVFPSMLDIQLPFSIDDCQFRVLDTVADDHSVTATAAGARNADITALFDQYEQCHLHPDMLLHPGVALRNSFQKELRTGTGSSLLLWIRQSRVLLVHCTGTHIYDVQEWPLSQDLPAEKQLERRIKQSILTRINADSVQPVPDPIEKIVICYSDDSDRALCSVLQQHLDTIMPEAAIRIVDEAHAVENALLHRLITNDLKKDVLFTKTTEQTGTENKYRIALFVAICTIITLGFLFTACQLGRRRVAELTARRSEWAQNMLGYVPHLGQEMILCRRALEQDGQQWEKIQKMTASSICDATAIIAKTASDYAIALESLTVSQSYIVASGTAPDKGALNKLETALQSQGYTTKLQQNASSRNAWIFTLEGTAQP
ncbi:MAG: hypothetical protein EOL87_16960 [Spartobacteria bacterium]|nr:hypothetical protein [Spartobacteria bacterium]